MKLTIVLPFPLPTWNRILQMQHYQRKDLRHKIHQLVSMCTQYASDSVTLTVSPQKQQLMDLYTQEYLKMIRPSTLSKSHSVKKKRKAKKGQSLKLEKRVNYF